jgi:hypothetical protein
VCYSLPKFITILNLLLKTDQVYQNNMSVCVVAKKIPSFFACPKHTTVHSIGKGFQDALKFTLAQS